jgi:hypothetical protein
MVTAASAGLVLVAGIAIAIAAPGSHAAEMSSADRAAAKAHTDVPVTPMQIVSVTPSNSAHNVNGALPITVSFNEPLATNSPMPTLSPKVAGSWAVNGDDAVFTPTAGYTEDTKVTLNIPGGASGMQAEGAAESSVPGAGLLASSVKDKFSTGSYSTMRLQQLLAQLGYLPLKWTPTSTNPAATNANGQLSAAYDPPAGTFTWQSGYPSILRTFWSKGKNSLIDEGAVRSFEWQHGLTMDGAAGSHVWRDLLTAIGQGKDNQHGYTYALASKASPETLTIWHNGTRCCTPWPTPASRQHRRPTAHLPSTCATTTRS